MSKRHKRHNAGAGRHGWSAQDWDNEERFTAGEPRARSDYRRDERRRDRRAALPPAPPSPIYEPDPGISWQEALLSPFGVRTAGATRTCGLCRNWITHQEPGGRGTCDHPGSGFAYPFEDTPACPFFERRR